jgi:hypothetical protein
MLALPLLAALAAPSVKVDGSALDDPATHRRVVGHVIERLLEAHVVVDPRASSHLRLQPTEGGITVALVSDDGETIASADVIDRGGGPTLLELDLVQVAVDLAVAHGESSPVSKGARRIVVSPDAEGLRAEVLATAHDAGMTLVPDAVDAERIVCVGARDGEVVLAEAEVEAECVMALEHAAMHDTVAHAWTDLQTGEASRDSSRGAPHAAVASRPTEPEPPATEPPAARPHAPWSALGGLGIGVMWRPTAFDAAPSLDFEIASSKGLAFGAGATFVPSRGPDLVALDTMLGAGMGYRGHFGARGRYSVVPLAGVSVHAAWLRGDVAPPRADPMLTLPFQLEARVHRRVAIGGRLALVTTFRGRIHRVNGLELWRRGAVAIVVSATVRFGG